MLADACAELGIRAVLCYGATERNDGADEARRGLHECRRFIEENERRHVRGLVALHASFTVSDATVAAAAEMCVELRVPMHVHMAEDGADIVDAKERGYQGPLERLYDLHALPRGSILAHGVHLSEAQVRAARDHGCWFVQNPRSNDGNGVGYARNLSASHRVALGTDGYPSNLVDERGALFRLGVDYGDREDILEERCCAGQRLIGELFDAPFARATEGSTADLVVREKDGRVRHVLVGGEVVMRDGKLVQGDIEEITNVAEQEAARLWQRMGEL
ncbi:MAG: amidohydrolase family protein [Planctomycetota bacterium]